MSLRARLAVAAAVVLAAMCVNAVLVTATNRRFLVEQVDQQLRGATGVVRALQFPGGPGGGIGPPPNAGLNPGTTPGGSIPGELGAVPGSIPNGNPGSIPSRPPRTDDGTRGSLSMLWVGTVEADESVQRMITPGLGPSTDPVIDPAEARRSAASGEPFDAVAVSGPERFRIAAHPISANRIAVVGLPLDRVDEASEQLMLALGAAGIVMAGFMALLAWWVWRLGLRPIRRITEAADAVRLGDRERRVEGFPARTEAGHMALALNTMLDERQLVEDRLRRFVGDASHELRSPLTSIHGYVDLYRCGALDDREALDDAMRRIAEESSRMVGLVDDLLLLAHLDQARPLARDAVDVALVLRDAASDASAMAPRRPVSLDLSEPLIVEGDGHRLRQVVAAIVANALAHTPPDAAVVLRGVPVAGGGVVIEIEDDGPGMTPEVAGHAFDRFFRGDPARSRDRGGSGLGLAIVESIVVNQGGHVELVTAPGAGTTVRIVLGMDPSADTDQPRPLRPLRV